MLGTNIISTGRKREYKMFATFFVAEFTKYNSECKLTPALRPGFRRAVDMKKKPKH